MRTFSPTLAVGLLLAAAVAGCTDQAEATPPPAPPPVTMPELPAAAAGGACALLDYDAVEARLGVRFNVAAASSAKGTRTCVLQARGASRPDLVLSVIQKTEADPELFTEELTPDGASAVKGLGRAAYRRVFRADRDAGAEVGWLTVDNRLLTLRYTGEGGEAKDAAAATARQLVALAKAVEAARRDG